MDDPHLLRGRMAQHLLLPKKCLFRGSRKLLRGFHDRCLLLPPMLLHRAGFAYAKGLLPCNQTEDLGLAVNLACKVLRW